MPKRILPIILLLLFQGAFAQDGPTSTYRYAIRDGQDLYLDYYAPKGGKSGKPLILFVCGGGFIKADKSEGWNTAFYKRLTEDGFPVVTIDYRTGMAGSHGLGLKELPQLYRSVKMGVEDLFDATAFVVRNASLFGADPKDIILAGASAGAIISLEAEWFICNDDPITITLPKGFRYKGIISYSGAIFDFKGKPTYKREPSPTLLLHGDSDRLVFYNCIRVLGIQFNGSSALARIWKRKGYNFGILRYKNHGHEIAGAFLPSYGLVTDFIRGIIEGGEKSTLDRIVDDPSIPASKYDSVNKMYSK